MIETVQIEKLAAILTTSKLITTNAKVLAEENISLGTLDNDLL